MKTLLLLSGVLLCAVLPSRAADDSVIEQIIANASKGSDEATAGQVREYVQNHRGAIDNIVDTYGAYLQQSLAITGDAPEVAENASQAAHSTGLQASGGLVASHLDGSASLGLSLPDVAPVSSITAPTDAQLEQAAAVNRKVLERKRFFMR